MSNKTNRMIKLRGVYELYLKPISDEYYNIQYCDTMPALENIPIADLNQTSEPASIRTKQENNVKIDDDNVETEMSDTDCSDTEVEDEDYTESSDPDTDDEEHNSICNKLSNIFYTIMEEGL